MKSSILIWLAVALLVAWYYFKRKKEGKPFLPNIVTRNDNTSSNTMNVRGDLVTAQDQLNNIPAMGTTFSPTPTMKPTGIDPVIMHVPDAIAVNPAIPSMAGPNGAIGTASDSIYNGVDLFQQIKSQNIIDSIPNVGQTPANPGAWENVFYSPGVYQWSLISNPSVNYLGDATARRLASA